MNIEQSDFDELLVQLIVKFRLPFSILDDEQFKRIVLFGRNLTLLSRYTLKQRLEIEKQEKHEMLKVFNKEQKFLRGCITHD